MSPCSSAVEHLTPFSLIPRLIVLRETTPATTPVRKKCWSIVIRSGKPQTSESLCNSCYWAHIQRGFAESEEVILCAFLRPARVVPFKVSQCTDYEDKRIPSRKDMEDIAWIIRTKDVNRQVGFTNDGQSEPQEDELEIVPSE
jgi:hypothetical protein